MLASLSLFLFILFIRLCYFTPSFSHWLIFFYMLRHIYVFFICVIMISRHIDIFALLLHYPRPSLSLRHVWYLCHICFLILLLPLWFSSAACHMLAFISWYSLLLRRVAMPRAASAATPSRAASFRRSLRQRKSRSNKSRIGVDWDFCAFILPLLFFCAAEPFHAFSVYAIFITFDASYFIFALLFRRFILLMILISISRYFAWFSLIADFSASISARSSAWFIFAISMTFLRWLLLRFSPSFVILQFFIADIFDASLRYFSLPLLSSIFSHLLFIITLLLLWWFFAISWYFMLCFHFFVLLRYLHAAFRAFRLLYVNILFSFLRCFSCW